MVFRAKHEAVEMLEQRHQFLPHIFRWRGRCCQVETVERCWTEAGRRKAVRCFRVQCSAGTFELCQDLSSGAWRLRRAGLLSAVRRNRHSRPAQASLRRSGQRREPTTGPVVWPTRRVHSAGGD